jgi:uncharacterized protein YegL
VLALDSSGSISEDNLETLKDFALGLMGRFQSEYYSAPAMRVGVVQFGNGQVQHDGTVTAASELVSMTGDFEAVNDSIASMTLQHGMTDMSRVFASAQRMLTGRGPKWLIVVTDGRPTALVAQAVRKAQQLEETGIRRLFVEISEHEGDDGYKLMNQWTSVPHHAHVIWIPGWTALQTDTDAWAGQVVAKFCPYAVSPMRQEADEDELGFMLLAKGKVCGDLGQMLQTRVPDAASCFTLAEGEGATAFAFGVGMRQGFCMTGALEVTLDMWDTWKTERAHPMCDGEEFLEKPGFDFYAIKPAA